MRRTIIFATILPSLCLASAPVLATGVQGGNPSAFQRVDLPQWPQRPIQRRHLGLPIWVILTPVLLPLDTVEVAPLPPQRAALGSGKNLAGKALAVKPLAGRPKPALRAEAAPAAQPVSAKPASQPQRPRMFTARRGFFVGGLY